MSWSLENRRVLDHFRIVSPIGAGGMGEVYLAEDVRLGRKVALKILSTRLDADEDRLRRFEQEARTVSALNHPNILTVHDTSCRRSSSRRPPTSRQSGFSVTPTSTTARRRRPEPCSRPTGRPSPTTTPGATRWCRCWPPRGNEIRPWRRWTRRAQSGLGTFPLDAADG
jgi:serine/threonine protein kinase